MQYFLLCNTEELKSSKGISFLLLFHSWFKLHYNNKQAKLLMELLLATEEADSSRLPNVQDFRKKGSKK